jgi:hypothetical protein
MTLALQSRKTVPTLVKDFNRLPFHFVFHSGSGRRKCSLASPSRVPPRDGGFGPHSASGRSPRTTRELRLGNRSFGRNVIDRKLSVDESKVNWVGGHQDRLLVGHTCLGALTPDRGNECSSTVGGEAHHPRRESWNRGMSVSMREQARHPAFAVAPRKVRDCSGRMIRGTLEGHSGRTAFPRTLVWRVFVDVLAYTRSHRQYVLAPRAARTTVR